MKKLFTLALLFIVTTASAQWSNTTNLFYDSLHTPVCNALKTQAGQIVVRSYPDSGYIVIWEDYRSDPSAYNAYGIIYAQKYDKTGKQLWAANGVPISTSPNNQHYTYQGQNYRNRSYAATDSAGGFYIVYADDSIASYVYQRVCIQHVRSDGSPVFPGPGYMIASSKTANQGTSPQLVADGNKGCYVSFMLTSTTIYAFCYKDVNGALQNFGGGMMNENALQVTSTSPCGNYTYLQYPDANVSDYNIFSDLQGGCNIVMSLSANGSGTMLAYNKLWRAKKNATSYQDARGIDYSVTPVTYTYQKDSAYRLYFLVTDHQEISCGSNPNVYTVNQYRLIQNGFQVIDGGSGIYDLSYPKGVTVSTTGNINTSLLLICERTYSSTTGVSDPFVKGYNVKEEIYDSIPYQRASFPSPDYPGYNQAEPAFVNKLNNFRDTLLYGPGGSIFDFSLAGGSNQVYTSGLITENGLSLGYRNLRLQHLAVESMGADSFAVVYKTSVKQGVLIGQDRQNYSTGGQYDLPVLTVNNAGNALFYIKESDGSTGPARVSPIFSGAQLAWGAMGRAVGTGIWNGSYYNVSSPVVSLDPVNGTALMSWTDARNAATNGPADIYMRHLDNLNDPNYQPPYTRVRAVPNPYGPVTTSQVLYGTSNTYSTFEATGPYGSDAGVSPVVDISDNYNLGNVNVSVYENTGGIRTYNGKPYLDRSYTIIPDHNPNGAATISIRLFFTTAEFNALKAADPSIMTPGDLAVIKQPAGSGSTYSVVAGEQTIIPQTWAAIDGGYYIQIQITSFSTFFIFKNANALPLNWLGVQAQWQNATQAKVSWQVADQQDVQSYTVQHSSDGNAFTDACAVAADPAQTQYSCIAAANTGINYYRVAETDNDGKINYSKVVVLQSAGQPGLTIYPNPVRDMLYVDGLANYKSLQLVNANGVIVLRQNIISTTQSVDVSRLAPGVYILTVTGNSDSKTFKFIKN
ncbi:MAG TPA: T9SS type A sorting domain-containing protein [Chitinophagaceae bacterium]